MPGLHLATNVQGSSFDKYRLTLEISPAPSLEQKTTIESAIGALGDAIPHEYALWDEHSPSKGVNVLFPVTPFRRIAQLPVGVASALYLKGTETTLNDNKAPFDERGFSADGFIEVFSLEELVEVSRLPYTELNIN